MGGGREGGREGEMGGGREGVHGTCSLVDRALV